MEVKLTYNANQLEEAVKFIARNNIHFQGQKDYIRDTILDHMRQIAKNPEEYLSGTMGYTLWGDRTFEGIDDDTNTIHFEISVDPALGYDHEESDYVEEIVNG